MTPDGAPQRTVVHLISYPRSGSTFTRTCFALLQGSPQLSEYQGDIVTAEGGPLTDSLDDIRIVKSHHFRPWHERAVYLVRDGRNAMVSNLYLRYLSGSHELKSPSELTEGLELLASEGESWPAHLNRAVSMAETKPVCFVRFEDLLSDPARELRTMIEFVRREVPDSVIDQCVELAHRSRAYFEHPLSGYAHTPSPGSIYEKLQTRRDADYWDDIFDANARRWFHEEGGTPHLLRFGYESSADWWKDDPG